MYNKKRVKLLIRFICTFSTGSTDGKLSVPILDGKCNSARILGGEKVSVEQDQDGVVISLPDTMPNPLATVIALEVQPGWSVGSATLKPAEDGSITLDALTASLHPGHGELQIQVESIGGVESIGFWTSPEAWISWNLRTNVAGEYDLLADVASLW